MPINMGKSRKQTKRDSLSKYEKDSFWDSDTRPNTTATDFYAEQQKSATDKFWNTINKGLETLSDQVTSDNKGNVEIKPKGTPDERANLSEFSTAYQNAPEQTKSWIKGQVKAVTSSLTMASNTMDIGRLSFKQMEQGLTDEETAQLADLQARNHQLQIDTAKDPFAAKAFGQLAPFVLNSALKGGRGAMIGAMIGGIAAAIAGQIGPQAALPEEGFTVPAASLIGAKIGGMFYSVDDMRKIEAGSAYRDLVDAGVSHEYARIAAHTYGAVSGATEMAQFKFLTRMIPGAGRFATKTFRNALLKGIKNYSQNVGGEAGVESLQQVMQNVIDETTRRVHDKYKGTDLASKDVMAKLSQGVVESFTTTGVGLGIMGLPSMGVQIALPKTEQAQAQLTDKEITPPKSNRKKTIQPVDLTQTTSEWAKKHPEKSKTTKPQKPKKTEKPTVEEPAKPVKKSKTKPTKKTKVESTPSRPPLEELPRGRKEVTEKYTKEDLPKLEAVLEDSKKAQEELKGQEKADEAFYGGLVSDAIKVLKGKKGYAKKEEAKAEPVAEETTPAKFNREDFPEAPADYTTKLEKTKTPKIKQTDLNTPAIQLEDGTVIEGPKIEAVPFSKAKKDSHEDVKGSIKEARRKALAEGKEITNAKKGFIIDGKFVNVDTVAQSLNAKAKMKKAEKASQIEFQKKQKKQILKENTRDIKQQMALGNENAKAISKKLNIPIKTVKRILKENKGKVKKLRNVTQEDVKIADDHLADIKSTAFAYHRRVGDYAKDVSPKDSVGAGIEAVMHYLRKKSLTELQKMSKSQLRGTLKKVALNGIQNAVADFHGRKVGVSRYKIKKWAKAGTLAQNLPRTVQAGKAIEAVGTEGIDATQTQGKLLKKSALEEFYNDQILEAHERIRQLRQKIRDAKDDVAKARLVKDLAKAERDLEKFEKVAEKANSVYKLSPKEYAKRKAKETKKAKAKPTKQIADPTYQEQIVKGQKQKAVEAKRQAKAKEYHNKAQKARQKLKAKGLKGKELEQGIIQEIFPDTKLDDITSEEIHKFKRERALKRKSEARTAYIKLLKQKQLTAFDRIRLEFLGMELGMSNVQIGRLLDVAKLMETPIKKRTKDVVQKINAAKKLLIAEQTPARTDKASKAPRKTSKKKGGIVAEAAKQINNEKGEAQLLVTASSKIVNTYQKVSKDIRKGWQALGKVADVEYIWKKMGAPELGFALKNYFSYQEAELKKVEQQAIQFAKLAKKSFGKRLKKEDWANIVLAAEQDNWRTMFGWDADYIAKIEGPAKWMRNFFDQSKSEFEDRGIHINFVERLTETLEQKIQDLVDENNKRIAEGKTPKANTNKMVTELNRRLSELQKMEFVHIPLQMWGYGKVKELVSAKNYREFRKKNAQMQLLTTKERKAVGIWDLLQQTRKQTTKIQSQITRLKEKDSLTAAEQKKLKKLETALAKERFTVDKINPFEIILNYGRRKGQDFAITEIRDAAEKAGFIKTKNSKGQPLKKKPADRDGKRWVKVPKNLAGLMRYGENAWIEDKVLAAINDARAVNARRNVLDRAMAIVKMSAFYNPFFLPMYDIVQQVMATGGMGLAFLPKAIIHMQRNTPEYREALRHGLASKPYGLPFQQWKTMAEKLHEDKGMLGKMADLLAQTAKVHKGSFLKPLYQLSWDMAWKMDETVRLATYFSMRKAGIEVHEAGQTAAMFHGDYASVPPNTRKWLNRFFFTPTFKIAMGKLWMNMIRGSIKTAYRISTGQFKKAKADQRALMYTLGAIFTFTINNAMNYLFTQLLGFEEDQWGRRYVKVIRDRGRRKEIAITFSTPHNIWHKYYHRAREAWFEPAVLNRLKHFLVANKWEAHPLYRTAYEIVENDAGGGKKIYHTLDSPMQKVSKCMGYGFDNIVQMSKAMKNIAKGPDPETERNAYLVEKEIGWLWKIAQHFAFGFSRSSIDQRYRVKARMYTKEAAKDARRMIRNRQRIPKSWRDNYLKEIQRLREQYKKEKAK